MSADPARRRAALFRQWHRVARVFWRGSLNALILPAWIVGFGQFGVGAVGADIGLPLTMVTLSTPLVWAGPAQFVLFGGLAAGVGLLTIVAAVSLTAIRLLPMAISLLTLLRQPQQGIVTRLALAHLVVVTTWVEGMKVLTDMARRDRVAWYIGFGLTCIAISTVMTALGHILSGGLPRYMAAGFMFVTPLFFLLSLIAAARAAPDVVAIGLGLMLGVTLGPLVGPDLDLLLAGTIGGCVSFAIWRRRR